MQRDLRLDDQPALQAATQSGAAVLVVFNHDPAAEVPWEPGAARNWWQHHALADLAAQLESLGQRLWAFREPTEPWWGWLAEQLRPRAVHWNRRYEPAVVSLQQRLASQLESRGIAVHLHNGSVLFEPEAVRNKAGKPFQVFTPFWKHCLTLERRPLLRLDRAALGRAAVPPPVVNLLRPRAVSLEQLNLLPRISWDKEFYASWQPTVQGGHQRLKQFAQGILNDYAGGRDRPDQDHTSRLSPYLQSGQLSPGQILQAVEEAPQVPPNSLRRYVAEIGWREFSYHLLHHFPQTPEQALRPEFNAFPSQLDEALLRAWQRGQTGYPIVDAGMRQLWATGWMHNRVRMICASVLVKHFLQPWQEGARWFWDTLVDADLASNTQGWQWTAGCGADAAPYFRVFNPMIQGAKFDPDGAYVRRWVPELAAVPTKYIHAPWEAPASELQAADLALGTHYPYPAVEHQAGRQRALRAFEELKQLREG